MLLLAGCSGVRDAPTGGREESGARAVSIAQVELRPMPGAFAAPGLLVAFEEAAVSPEFSGFRIASVLVDQGAYVKAGHPLVRLDDTLLRSRIAQAHAQLVQVQAQAAQAAGEAARVRGLDGSGILSDEQIATRRFQAQSAQAAVEVARAQLRDLQTQQSRMIIRAPVSGVILEKNVRPGAISAPGGEPLFRIARDRLIELDAEVPEAELAAMAVGTPAVVTLPSGLQLKGSVRLVSPSVDPRTKLGRVRVRLPISDQLRAGGFARANFQRGGRDVPAVPEKAIQFEATGPQLVVIDKHNRARKQAIRPGARDRGWVELVRGPAVGTRVALGGGAFLLEGDQVRPIKRNAPGPGRTATPVATAGN
ncbi:efflux RND transporter periplasmic adaptor subunit [Sphingopyxis fribergensis]